MEIKILQEKVDNWINKQIQVKDSKGFVIDDEFCVVDESFALSFWFKIKPIVSRLFIPKAMFIVLFDSIIKIS